MTTFTTLFPDSRRNGQVTNAAAHSQPFIGSADADQPDRLADDVPGAVLADADAPVAPANLQAIGYEKAEKHRGNANALENLLNRVLRGYLVDERNDDSRRREHEQRVDTQLLALEKQVEEAQTEIRKVNTSELPALRDELTMLDDEIHQIRTDEAEGRRDPNHLDRFRLRLNTGLVLLLTLFVYLFYVSAFYSAFYRDLAGELTAAGPDRQASVLSAIFAQMAFRVFDFHWFGPLLLFAFGGYLHVLAENKTRTGRLLLGTMILVVFLTDGLIAYFVEVKQFDMKVMMGMANVGDHRFYTAPVFWLVIAMGFVAAMVWSGLLHALMYEYGKKDVSHLTALEIRHRQDKQKTIREEVSGCTSRLADLDGQIAQIEIDIRTLRESRKAVVFSPAELEKYVTDFYDGWLTYVNNRMGNDAPLRTACDTVIRAFYGRHLNTI